MKPKKPKKKTRKQLVKILDEIFSQFIRLKYSKNGVCECYTCNTRLERKAMQNGHFITRGCYVLRRSEDNCRPQCVGCNVFKHGNYVEYTLRMIKELGLEKVERLKNRKYEVVSFKDYELEEMIDHFRGECKKLLCEML